MDYPMTSNPVPFTVELLPLPDNEEVQRLNIQAADGEPFEHIWLSGPAGDWHLFELAYREHMNEIETISSELIAVEIPSVIDELPPVLTPRLTRLAGESIPATVDPAHQSDGEVALSSSQVAISCDVFAWPEGPFQPARLIVGRSTGPDSGEPETILTVNEGFPSPAVFQKSDLNPPLPELQTAWPLEGHLKDLKSGQSAEEHGLSQRTIRPGSEAWWAWIFRNRRPTPASATWRPFHFAALA
jgi:hypothetical protein